MSALTLEGELTIRSVALIRPQLMTALDAEGLTLDVSVVNQVDSAGLQLLIAAARRCASAGLPLRLQGHCSPLSQAMALFGLTGLFTETAQ